MVVITVRISIRAEIQARKGERQRGYVKPVTDRKQVRGENRRPTKAVLALHIFEMVPQIPVTRAQLRRWIEQDITLARVRSHTLSGWSRTNREAT